MRMVGTDEALHYRLFLGHGDAPVFMYTACFAQPFARDPSTTSLTSSLSYIPEESKPRQHLEGKKLEARGMSHDTRLPAIAATMLAVLPDGPCRLHY